MTRNDPESVCRRARVVVASESRETVARIREAFTGCPDVQMVGVASDSIEAAQMTAATQPDIVVVDSKFDGDGLHLCGVLNRIAPHVKVILLVSGINEDVVIEAARAGAREVLEYSFEPQAFLDSLGRLTSVEMQSISRDYELAVSPEHFPRVIVVTGAKGGAGTTSLATNLAVCLSASNTGKTVLLDCSPTFPDTRNLLDLNPPLSLADAFQESELVADQMLDPDMLEQCIVHTCAQLDVVISTSSNLLVPPPTARVVSRAIRTLKRFYRYVVIDSPPSLLLGREPAIPSFWRLLVMANTNEVALLQNTKRLLQRITADYQIDGSITVVVNRFSKGGGFAVKDIQNALGIQTMIMIPDDASVGKACNIGKPAVMEYPRAPASRAVLQLSEEILEAAKYAATG